MIILTNKPLVTPKSTSIDNTLMPFTRSLCNIIYSVCNLKKKTTTFLFLLMMLDINVYVDFFCF